MTRRIKGLEKSVGKLVTIKVSERKDGIPGADEYLGVLRDINQEGFVLNLGIRLDLVAKDVGEARARWFNDWLKDLTLAFDPTKADPIVIPRTRINEIGEWEQYKHYRDPTLVDAILGACFYSQHRYQYRLIYRYNPLPIKKQKRAI